MPVILALLLLHWFAVALGFWELHGDCQHDEVYPDLCITSLNFPNNYSNRESCSMKIVGEDESVLLVLAFDTEPGYDNFEIGSHRFSGDDHANITGKVVDASTVMNWKSDTAGTRSGWRICAVPNTHGPWLSVGDCRVQTRDPECLSTEAYPLNYKAHQKCFMAARADRPRVLSVTPAAEDEKAEAEGSDDTLAVVTPRFRWTSRGAPWQARLNGQLLDIKESMVFKWTSSPEGSGGPGWQICARPERASESPIWNLSELTSSCIVRRDSTDNRCIYRPYSSWISSTYLRCYVSFSSSISRVLELSVMNSTAAANWYMRAEYDDDLGHHSSYLVAADLVGAPIQNGTRLSWNDRQSHLREGWKLCAVAEPREMLWTISGDCNIDAADSECISSLNYPSSYGNNESCSVQTLNSQPRLLEVTSFSAGGDSDFFFLQGLEGTSNFSSSVADLHGTSIDGGMTLTWTSGGSNANAGWRICSRFLRTTTTTTTTSTTTVTWTNYEVWSFLGDCEIDASDPECITSKNFSDGGTSTYSRADRCTMRILDSERQLVVTAFNTSNFYAALHFEGVSYGGTNPGAIHHALVTPDMPLQWTVSGHSWAVVGNGWRICAVPVGTLNQSSVTSRSWNVTGDCLIDEEDEDCITTPNFPDAAPPLQRCQIEYKGKSQRMLVAEGLPPHHWSERIYLKEDYWYRYDPAELSGRTLGPTRRLKWGSETDQVSTRGWKICARPFPVWSVQGPCQVEDGGCISSPHYPSSYWNGESCHMEVTNFDEMPLVIKSFFTEPDYDFLTFNGHQYSGYRSAFDADVGPLVGSLTWRSDSDTTRSGWKICGRPSTSEMQMKTVTTTTTSPRTTTSYYYSRRRRRTTGGYTNEYATTTTYDYYGYDYNNSHAPDWGLIFANILGLVFLLLCVCLAVKYRHRLKQYCCRGKRELVESSPEVDPEAEIQSAADRDSPGGHPFQCRACGSSFPSIKFPNSLKVSCPSCLQTNEFCWTQDVAGSTSPEAPLPAYWTSNRALNKSAGLVFESDDIKRDVQALLDRTWTPQLVSEGSGSDQLWKFEVVMVHRGENLEKWDRYARTRSAIAEQCRGRVIQQQVETQTEVPHSRSSTREPLAPCLFSAASWLPKSLWREPTEEEPPSSEFVKRTQLDEGCNEFLLFRGATPFACKAIAEDNFQLKRAKATFASPGAGAGGVGSLDAEEVTRAICPRCRTENKFPASVAGRGTEARCGSCQQHFWVPEQNAPQQPEVDAAVKSSRGARYGPGFYFAEASSKADLHASTYKKGFGQDLYAMLICRVVCGNMKYTDEAEPDVDGLLEEVVTTREKHSVLGDRSQSEAVCREFVVFDRDQVYPEFAVVYRRVPIQTDGETE